MSPTRGRRRPGGRRPGRRAPRPGPRRQHPEHHGQPAPGRPRGPACAGRGPLVELAEHGRRPGGVVVLEGGVVLLVDVARLVLALEVLQRAQQEVALLLERVWPRCGVAHRSCRACSTRARSSSVAATSGVRRHRANTADRATSATTTRPPGGSTRVPRTRTLADELHLVAVGRRDLGPDHAGRLSLLHQLVISMRMARDAPASESATDWLRHTGHLRVLRWPRPSPRRPGGPSDEVARASVTSTSAAITNQLAPTGDGSRRRLLVAGDHVVDSAGSRAREPLRRRRRSARSTNVSGTWATP